VSRESSFIDSLRALASSPAARDLIDDAAVLEWGGKSLVLTHDMIVEDVHYLAADPPEDVAWKLVAVNLSDLAAKGASPIGLLLGYSLSPDDGWNEAFVRGFAEATARFGAPLLGGDTVGAAPGTPRTLALTAIGEAASPPPARSGAAAGDELWVSGTIGDAGAGLGILQGRLDGPDGLVRRYRRPEPRLGLGSALARLASAMMDVSDGLLIDAARMADASRLRAAIELAEMPLSPELIEASGQHRQARLDAATAGDDYELLFAAPPARAEAIAELSAALAIPLTRIGRLQAGQGLVLLDGGAEIPLPGRLGYEHGGGRG
jgi:thiamine-monophosphate kinase